MSRVRPMNQRSITLGALTEHLPTGVKLGVTGHRSDKLGGYTAFDAHEMVKVFMREAIALFAPTELVQGGALGVDQWAAEMAIEAKIRLVSLVPFDTHGENWPAASRAHYRALLAQSAEVTVVTPGGYSNIKYLIRNEAIVDRVDVMLAVWDGSMGGTGNCVQYARRVRRPLFILNPMTGVLRKDSE